MSKLAELLRGEGVPLATPATSATPGGESSKGSDCSSGGSVDARMGEGVSEAFEERAAIMEYEAGLSRASAERKAASHGRPDSVDLARRRARVVHQLEEDPGVRVVFNALNAPLKPEPGEPVSVVVAIRTDGAGIVSTELLVPRDRFDFVLFTKTLEETARRPS